MTSQVGHNILGSNDSNNFSKLLFSDLTKKPGYLQTETVKKSSVSKKNENISTIHST